MRIKPANPNPTSRAPRAFTLAELLVAVSVVIVLSLAIGQVFSAVGKLVGAGAAVSEVDQLARGIERQMRDDFEAFGRFRTDETFFAIRSRTLGDANNNGIVEVGNGEISLYLTQNDKDTDLRSGVANAYQRDPTTGNQIGKGVTARLDEMVFLARAPGKGKFASFQQGGAEGEPVLADTARIYYGHGLLPASPRNPNGSEFNPTVATTTTNRAVRRLHPDTRSVTAPGNPGQDSAHAPTQQDLAWGRVFGEAFSRNEFATDFPLLRQPLLLFGGRAAGNAGSANQSAEINSTDSFRRRTYVPFIRDRENQTRSVPNGTGFQYDLRNGWHYPPQTLSSPRMLRWGRTDICAQDRDDVQRWLEGLETSDSFALNDPLYDPPEASAFSRGILEDSETGRTNTPPTWKLAGTDFSNADAALMYRLPAHWGSFGGAGGANLTPDQAVQIATTRLRSAVAGVFSRMLCEPTQPTVATRINPTAGLASAAPVTTILDPVPADAAMDQHALLAPRCSSFEIAWSDGTTWNDTDPLNVYLGPTTAAANLIATYNRGDIVWFDSVFTRRQYRTVTQGVVPPVDTNDATAEPDPEVMGERTDPSYFAATIPASTKPSNSERDRSISTAENVRLLNVLPPAYDNSQFDNAAYDPHRSGGDPTEYLAIWGFRRPAVNVESLGTTAADQRMALTWSQSKWEKPKYIRVRMTLHDSLNRIAGGKFYEFVFALEPAAN